VLQPRPSKVLGVDFRPPTSVDYPLPDHVSGLSNVRKPCWHGTSCAVKKGLVEDKATGTVMKVQ
jgi:hypothetical protein